MIRWLVLFLLIAVPAAAQEWRGNCDGTGTILTAIGAGEHCPTCPRSACLHLEQKGTIDSNVLTVRAPSVLFCFDPADDSDGADTAQVWIRKCLGSNVTASDNTCVRTTDAVLTGAGGAAGTQAACDRQGPGVYFIELVNDGNNDENPFVSAIAEE